MKVTIDIPKEFVNHYKGDRFKDSLERVLFDARGHRIIASNYEWELMEMLIEAFRKSEVLNV